MWLRYGHGAKRRVGGGCRSEGGLTDSRCSCPSKPCLPGAFFRCPIILKQQDILVQVMGTVHLVEKIEVAPPAGSTRSGCGPGGVRWECGGASHLWSACISCSTSRKEHHVDTDERAVTCVRCAGLFSRPRARFSYVLYRTVFCPWSYRALHTRILGCRAEQTCASPPGADAGRRQWV